MVIRHLKQNGKVKKLDKWVPHKLTANQKNSWFEVFAFSYCTQQQQFHNLIVTCDNKWILYNWWRPAQLVDREAVSKHTQSQTYTKKSHGHCLAICCQYDPLQLSEFWRNHYIWEVYSANQWGALNCPTVVNRKGPTLHDNTQLHVTQPMLQKLNELGYKVLPLTPYSPDLLPTNYHSSCISTVFCRENASTTRRRQKMLSKSSSNPEAWIFMPQEWTNLFFIDKNVLIAMVSILINKDVFEPSYNDLKFIVWNHNYICTNLILL